MSHLSRRTEQRDGSTCEHSSDRSRCGVEQLSVLLSVCLVPLIRFLFVVVAAAELSPDLAVAAKKPSYRAGHGEVVLYTSALS
jgi:hypothetical protein